MTARWVKILRKPFFFSETGGLWKLESEGWSTKEESWRSRFPNSVYELIQVIDLPPQVGCMSGTDTTKALQKFWKLYCHINSTVFQTNLWMKDPNIVKEVYKTEFTLEPTPTESNTEFVRIPWVDLLLTKIINILLRILMGPQILQHI